MKNIFTGKKNFSLIQKYWRSICDGSMNFKEFLTKMGQLLTPILRNSNITGNVNIARHFKLLQLSINQEIGNESKFYYSGHNIKNFSHFLKDNYHENLIKYNILILHEYRFILNSHDYRFYFLNSKSFNFYI